MSSRRWPSRSQNAEIQVRSTTESGRSGIGADAVGRGQPNVGDRFCQCRSSRRGKSARKWPPRLSSRRRAACVTSRPTVTRLDRRCSSGSKGCSVAGQRRPARPSSKARPGVAQARLGGATDRRAAASRPAPARRSGSDLGPAAPPSIAGALRRRSARAGHGALHRPRGPGAERQVFEQRIAGGPVAPCTPIEATSPAAKRFGTDVRPRGRTPRRPSCNAPPGCRHPVARQVQPGTPQAAEMVGSERG